MINDLLFVYGTLLLADNEFARYLRSNATFYSAGKFKGRLFDMGDYPGVITDKDYNYDISGSIYQLTSADVLKAIDAYEGYGEGQPLPYLYIREKLPIVTADGVVDCWIYLYNQPLDGLVEIVSGDYLGYLRRS